MKLTLDKINQGKRNELPSLGLGDTNQEHFGKDNFSVRRTQGNNMYDPESLMSGEESARGMTYENSRRVFPSLERELDAIHGRIGVDEVLRIAPRVRMFHKLAMDVL